MIFLIFKNEIILLNGFVKCWPSFQFRSIRLPHSDELVRLSNVEVWIVKSGWGNQGIGQWLLGRAGHWHQLENSFWRETCKLIKFDHRECNSPIPKE